MLSRPGQNSIASILSITAVFFFLGMFILIPLGLQVVVDTAKEELEYKIMLTDEVTPELAKQYMQSLATKPYIKRVRFVSKQDALKEVPDLGKEFLDNMDGFIPFPASINLRLRSDFIQPDSIRSLTRNIMQNTHVSEVDYPINLIEKVNERTILYRNVSIGVGFILVIVSFLLVLNMIRLEIFANRLLIRSMQLIGATRNFIRMPFMKKGLFQTGAGAFLSVLFLHGSLIIFSSSVVNLDILIHSITLKILYLLLFSFGLMVGMLGSTMAVNRYLDKKLDEII